MGLRILVLNKKEPPLSAAPTSPPERERLGANFPTLAAIKYLNQLGADLSLSEGDVTEGDRGGLSSLDFTVGTSHV